MARKREEKQRKKKQKEVKHVADNTVAGMNSQLAVYGLILREVPGDGNCLFRALGDQLDGHMTNHLKYRLDTCQFMREHRTDFEPFIEDDVSFEKHVYELEQPGTYAGNDAIVAFARYQGAIIVIHQLNAPLWQVHGLTVTEHQDVRELHIAYHNGDHYDSVRFIGDSESSPACIKLLGLTADKGEASGLVLEELTDMERMVIEKSGCQDVSLVHNALEHSDYDVPSAVGYLVNMLRLVDGSDDKSWSSDLSWSQDEAKPQDTPTTSKAESKNKQQRQHLSNRKRKELQRQERKRQSEERKKKSAVAVDTTAIVRQVEALSI